MGPRVSLVKRSALLRKIRDAAKAAGVDYEEVEMTRHTGLIVGGVKTGVGRHNEIDEITAGKICKHFEQVLGEGWWR